MPDQLLKTKQVAKLLDLSDSTVKRLVDSGAIVAVRTPGGHRLIPRAEVDRFRSRRAEELERGYEALTDSADVLRLVPTVESLLKALRIGDATLARKLILRAHQDADGCVALADDLIRPVMQRIGHDWQSASLDVFEEHRASRIVESTLLELIRATPAPRPRSPLAIGATPEGDLYTLSGLLCELALRQLGWDVVNLGPNLPLPSLAKAVRVHQPRLVWLSVNHLASPSRFIDEYKLFHDSISRSGTAIVLGGSAMSPDLRANLVAASFGDRMSHLREFARGLAPLPTPSPLELSDRQR